MTAAAALDAKATGHAEHEFWPLGREIPAGLLAMASRLTGHRQWTNVVLLRHALERGGVLVTFDSGGDRRRRVQRPSSPVESH
jgi:hypothetical protein